MKKTAYKHSCWRPSCSKIADWQMRDEFEWRDLVGSWRFFWGVFYFLGLGNDCTFLEEVVYNNWYFDYIYIHIWPSTIILHRHWQWNKNTREQWVHAPPSKTVKWSIQLIKFNLMILYTYIIHSVYFAAIMNHFTKHVQHVPHRHILRFMP